MTITQDLSYDFHGTVADLVKGVQVRHILTPVAQLKTCQGDECVADIFQKEELTPYDQIPVKENKRIVGLLQRKAYDTGERVQKASRLMKPLSDVLVSADTSLLNFIFQVNPLDRLVVDGAKIIGLVTKSDLLKLPTRLLGYALVTQVEIQMLNLIRDTEVEEKHWISFVGDRDRLNSEYEKLKKDRSDPDKLELTTFTDKQYILRWLVSHPEYTKQLPDEQEVIEPLKDIRELRNMVAHTEIANADYQGALSQLVYRLRRTDKWLQSITTWRQSGSR